MRMADPTVAGNPDEFMKLSKSVSELEETVNTYGAYKSCLLQLKEAQELVKEETDPEMVELAREEIAALKQARPGRWAGTRTRAWLSFLFCFPRQSESELEENLKILLLPKDPLDERSVMLEIRAGTGGDEAALWCADLMRMYERYSNTQVRRRLPGVEGPADQDALTGPTNPVRQQGWKLSMLSLSEAEGGGLKEAIAQISGDRVYSKLKWEAGVHRVQRVPATETQGRQGNGTAPSPYASHASLLDPRGRVPCA